MLILICLYPFIASRGFLLTHPLIGSTTTSGAGSMGIGANGTHPSQELLNQFIGAMPLINSCNNEQSQGL